MLRPRPRRHSRAWSSLRAGSPRRARPLPAPGAEPSARASAPRRAQRRRPSRATRGLRPPGASPPRAARQNPVPARPRQGRAVRTCTARLRKVPASAASFFTLKSMMFILGRGADSAQAPAAAAAAPARPCGSRRGRCRARPDRSGLAGPRRQPRARIGRVSGAGGRPAPAPLCPGPAPPRPPSSEAALRPARARCAPRWREGTA